MSAVDDAEFTAFMRGRYAALVRTATLLVGDPGIGEDLVQTALFKTAQRWRRLADPSAAESYTRTVMVRQAARWGQRKWRGERPTAELPEVDVPDQADEVALADALQRELAALPFAQRSVLVLRYYEDLTESDVAVALGCSVGTVKSRASRGLATLRERGVISTTGALG